MEKLDEIDIQLIEMLQKNARTPLKVLAQTVFLSSPSVSARIARLEKEGIITGYTAQVNRIKLGYHITAFINLEVPPSKRHEFYDCIRSFPNVLECHRVSGEYSMLIKAAFPETEELDAFVGRLQSYGKTSTQVVFSNPVEPRGLQEL